MVLDQAQTTCGV